jgi:hypothetical protein
MKLLLITLLLASTISYADTCPDANTREEKRVRTLCLLRERNVADVALAKERHEESVRAFENMKKEMREKHEHEEAAAQAKVDHEKLVKTFAKMLLDSKHKLSKEERPYLTVMLSTSYCSAKQDEEETRTKASNNVAQIKADIAREHTQAAEVGVVNLSKLEDMKQSLTYNRDRLNSGGRSAAFRATASRRGLTMMSCSSVDVQRLWNCMSGGTDVDCQNNVNTVDLAFAVENVVLGIDD